MIFLVVIGSLVLLATCQERPIAFVNLDEDHEKQSKHFDSGHKLDSGNSITRSFGENNQFTSGSFVNLDEDNEFPNRDRGAFVNLDEDNEYPSLGTAWRLSCLTSRYGCGNRRRNTWVSEQIILGSMRRWQWQPRLIQGGSVLSFRPFSGYFSWGGQFRLRVRRAYTPGQYMYNSPGHQAMYPFTGLGLNYCPGDPSSICFDTARFQMQAGIRYIIEVSYVPPEPMRRKWPGVSGHWMYLTTLEGPFDSVGNYRGNCRQEDPCWTTLNHQPCQCPRSQQCVFRHYTDRYDQYRKYCQTTWYASEA